MGTIAVNGKVAQVIFCDDSLKYRLHYTVQYFEKYKPVDGELYLALSDGGRYVDISLDGKRPFTAQVISYETNAPVTGDIEVTVSLSEE